MNKIFSHEAGGFGKKILIGTTVIAMAKTVGPQVIKPVLEKMLKSTLEEQINTINENNISSTIVDIQ